MFRCEVSARKVLPVIRCEMAKMLKKQGKKTCEIAKLLDTTPAAISQYLSGKRGQIDLTKSEMVAIKQVVERGDFTRETICQLCRQITGRVYV
jgi:predicted transcriptional regulator